MSKQDEKIKTTFLLSKEILLIELRSYGNKLVYRMRCPTTDTNSINSALELLKNKYNINVKRKNNDEDWWR